MLADALEVNPPPPDVVVLDEAQRSRTGAQRPPSDQAPSQPIRVRLTGAPIENRIDELHR
jgi:hypothetical protein